LIKQFYFFALSIIAFCGNAVAQNDSALVEKPHVQISGFLDVFYCFDGNQPTTNFRQPFIYNHNRHNEINVNLALVKFAITHSKYRANFALHAGTYVNDNYYNEPDGIRQINEANIGVALNKKNNLWLDAGILPSHIGFESAISKDNWNLTRSLLADNSPYFLTGLKFTYTPNKKWEFAGLICNGWQVIQRAYSNALPAVGSQLKYAPNEKFSFNWSTYVGTEDTGSRMVIRYFNNFYSKMQFSKRIGLTLGFDYGAEEIAFEKNKYSVWMSPICIIRYSLNQKWAMSFRAEYFEDKDQVVISTTAGTFAASGLSLNVDYAPLENILCRIEGRWFKSPNKQFVRNGLLVTDDYFITSSIALSF
jgi:hypothetical protein